MLDDHGRLAGKIFSQMVRDDLRSDLKAATLGTDEDRDGFSLVIGSLGPREGCQKRHKGDGNDAFESQFARHMFLL
jgi:hypothetical protein